MHPTAAVAPHGVVTRQSVVPGPPTLVPQVRGAACAVREAIVAMKGLAHAAATAWRRNRLRERPSFESRIRSSIALRLVWRATGRLSVVSAP